jgi:hypothetical protein
MKNTGDSTNWRAQVIMHKTKLSQVSKKLLSWRGELEGTINTLKRRAQKITQETKLPKISKKWQVGGDNKYPIGGHK